MTFSRVSNSKIEPNYYNNVNKIYPQNQSFPYIIHKKDEKDDFVKSSVKAAKS